MEAYLSEKEQWEAVKAWLWENGPWMLGGVAIAVAAVAGWRWYQERLDQRGMQASVVYEQILQELERGDRSQALVRLGQLERDYPASPYVDQARLSAARAYVESGDLALAAKDLQAVADHSADQELRIIARLRLARVQIAQQKPDLALSTVSGLQAGAFASQFHEVRGDALYAKGDRAGALKEYFTAKAGQLGSQIGGQGEDELDLKISDLAATPATGTGAATAGATSESQPVAPGSTQTAPVTPKQTAPVAPKQTAPGPK